MMMMGVAQDVAGSCIVALGERGEGEGEGEAVV
jgi:hypothetical protein